MYSCRHASMYTQDKKMKNKPSSCQKELLTFFSCQCVELFYCSKVVLVLKLPETNSWEFYVNKKN